MTRKFKLIAFALAVFMLIAPAVAQDKTDVLVPGFDYWQTVGGGATFMDFTDNPIPADFFCEGSEAFTGKIILEGVPLTTQPAGELGTTDTVVERLEPAAFVDGVAHSRIRIKAIHLISREVMDTGCGQWNVSMGLTEKQPVTDIVYEKTGDDHGHFSADLVLNARITFTHAVNKKLTRVLERTVHFSEFHQAPFQMRPVANDDDLAQKHRVVAERMLIDTDADGRVDSRMAITVTTVGTGVTYTPYGQRRCEWPEDSGDDDDCVWQYPSNAEICNGDGDCVTYGSMHQAPPPGHVHTVIPPCSTYTGSGWCSNSPQNPGWLNPRVIKVDGQTINQTLAQMWDDGILIIPPEDVLQEMIDKVNNLQK